MKYNIVYFEAFERRDNVFWFILFSKIETDHSRNNTYFDYYLSSNGREMGRHLLNYTD